MAEAGADNRGLYKRFNDKAAEIITWKGWLFIPVVFAVGGLVATPTVLAAAASSTTATGAAATAVSNGNILTSIYSLFYTNAAAGSTGLTAGFGNIWNGALAYGSSAFDVASAGLSAAVDPNVGVIESLGKAWNAPLDLSGAAYGYGI